jgi:ABC-type transport system substrate-binding protein
MGSDPNRRVWTAVALSALLVVLVACGGGETAVEPTPTRPSERGGTGDGEAVDAGEPVYGGTVVWGLEDETDGLNPISGRFIASGHLMASAIFDPLASTDNEGNWVPHLAERLEPNGDFTEWIITLREGVVFHDGTPLTAQIVADTLNLHRDSAISQRAIYLVDRVEATGPLQVRITLSQPWPTLPYILGSQIGYIPAPSMLDVPEEARTPIGTGPFKFQEWDYGRSFKAVRNESYWRTDEAGRRLPYLDGIEFRPIPDPQMRSEQLINRSVDAILTSTLSEVSRLLSIPDLKVLTYSEGEELYVALQTDRPPFDNLTARRAVAHATDTDAVRAEIGAGLAQPAESLWAPGQLGYREDAGRLRFDLEEARRLVAEYEAQTGQPLAFSLMATPNTDVRRLQQLLKAQWEAAGMQVSLETYPQADLVVRFVLGNYQAGISRLFGSPEPDTEFVWLHSSTIDPDLISLNIPRFDHPGIDAALERARTSDDPQVRDEAYAEVARILNDQTAVVWLFRTVWSIAAADNVSGFGQAANGSMQTLGAKTWMATLWKS